MRPEYRGSSRYPYAVAAATAVAAPAHGVLLASSRCAAAPARSPRKRRAHEPAVAADTLATRTSAALFDAVVETTAKSFWDKERLAERLAGQRAARSAPERRRGAEPRGGRTPHQCAARRAQDLAHRPADARRRRLLHPARRVFGSRVPRGARQSLLGRGVHYAGIGIFSVRIDGRDFVDAGAGRIAGGACRPQGRRRDRQRRRRALSPDPLVPRQGRPGGRRRDPPHAQMARSTSVAVDVVEHRAAARLSRGDAGQRARHRARRPPHRLRARVGLGRRRVQQALADALAQARRQQRRSCRPQVRKATTVPRRSTA